MQTICSFLLWSTFLFLCSSSTDNPNSLSGDSSFGVFQQKPARPSPSTPIHKPQYPLDTNLLLPTPSDKNVFDNRLVQLDISQEKLLQSYHRYHENTQARSFPGTVLTFNDDKDSSTFAQKFRDKIDIFVASSFVLEKEGDVDFNLSLVSGTMDKVQHVFQSFAQISFKEWDEVDYAFPDTLLISQHFEKLIRLTLFAGLVLDYSSVPVQYADTFFEEIGKAFESLPRSPKLVLLVPQRFSPDSFHELFPYFYRFIIQLEPVSTRLVKGPSPLWRMEATIRNLLEHAPPTTFKRTASSKIIFSLRLLGYSYSGATNSPCTQPPKPSTVRDLIQIMQQYKVPIHLDQLSQQHVFTVPFLLNQQHLQNENRTLFHPTLFSIAARINLAKKLGVGIALGHVSQTWPGIFDLI